MFVLPLFVGWNEKIRAGVYNRSELAALQISSTTGIPMINGRLSRNSTSKTLLATQMSSHPLIKKEVLDQLPNDKPLLLVQGRPIGNRLSFGEKSLKSVANEIFNQEKYFVFKVTLDDIEKEHQRWIKIANEHRINVLDKTLGPCIDPRRPISLHRGHVPAPHSRKYCT